MSNIIINKREAYTEKELASLIKKKMKYDCMTKKQLYQKYRKYFFSEKEIDLVLEGTTYFNYDIYKFIEEFLNIPFDELTKVVSDDELVSARGELEDEQEFINMLNYLFDEMIKLRRLNSEESCVFDKYLSGRNILNENNDMEECCRYLMNVFKINKSYPLNLFEIFENEKGFFILKFPNNFNVSGVTIVKNSVKDKEKFICIYVNTCEPVGRQNFTLAHELYHIIFEPSKYIESFIKDRYSDEIEKRAEEFASTLMIPRKKLLIEIKKLNKSKFRNLNFREIEKLQMIFGTTFQAIVYAINYSLKSNLKYKRFYEQIPKPDKKFDKCYRSDFYQEKLCEKTKKLTNLNCIEDKFIEPINFLKDLKSSLEKKIISRDEYSTILKFFEN